LFAIAKKTGGTPPISTPNGVATWYAAGNSIGESLKPAIAYTLLCAELSVTARRTVIMPAMLVAIVMTELSTVPEVGAAAEGGGVSKVYPSSQAQS
jgi:hypothetical protein